MFFLMFALGAKRTPSLRFGSTPLCRTRIPPRFKCSHLRLPADMSRTKVSVLLIWNCPYDRY
jgi:hypothetical protein